MAREGQGQVEKLPRDNWRCLLGFPKELPTHARAKTSIQFGLSLPEFSCCYPVDRVLNSQLIQKRFQSYFRY